MENPDTWGPAEKIVSRVYGEWADEKARTMSLAGLSLARRITDALREAGLLAEEGTYTRQQVTDALCSAVDEIESSDRMNLVVNLAMSRLDNPEITMDNAIEDCYSEDPETVRGWAGI